MRRWELYILTFLICFGASISGCKAADVPARKSQGRHFVPLVKSTSTSIPKDDVAIFVSEKAATHAPAINIGTASLAIIVGLLKTTDHKAFNYSVTTGPTVLHRLFLRSTISPNAP